MALPSWLDPHLYDAAGLREVDRWAIDERRRPSLELMEAAGRAVAAAVEIRDGEGPVRIVCGKGNNGGDGLVAARLLADAGFAAEVILLWPAEELSGDAKANLERFEGPVLEPSPEGVAVALAGSGAIVDAIFGTGFSGAPRSPAREAIEVINAAGVPVVACDVASGVDASTGEVEGVAVEADATVSFHAAKLGHLIAPGKRCTGALEVADIGIPAGAPAQPSGGVIALSVLELPPRRDAASTKFSSGDVLVVGGSRGMTGAASLAAGAAIRAGAGYAAVAAPASLEPIFEAKLTEVMTLGVAEDDGRLAPAAAEAILARAASAAAVVLGPGLGRAVGVGELVAELVEAIETALVLDADGLNALGEDLERLHRREAPTVLTPHPGELGRLLGRGSTAVSAARLDSAREAAERSGAVVVLKGDDTIVADRELLAVNALPSPGLATAGSGDVLAGTIGALLARGVEPFAAACAGVLGHARAGCVAAQRHGAESVIASDVIAALGRGLASG